jgi:septal ring factor EnvC (AmiA/AmiB activator)
MAAPAFDRLHRLLGAVRAVEEVRLAALRGTITGCHARARRLRAEAAGESGGPPSDAAGMAAEARWRERLAREARAEDARADDLASQAGPLRQALARAFGRERAAAGLVDAARAQARRDAGRRADTPAVAAPPALLAPLLSPPGQPRLQWPCPVPDPSPSPESGGSSS